LFSSHLLDEVQRVSDHVAMLHQGSMLLCDPLETVLQRHSRWTIRLTEPAATAPDIPGHSRQHSLFGFRPRMDGAVQRATV
jgi:ABC-2 type transport system ATP-binding protein